MILESTLEEKLTNFDQDDKKTHIFTRFAKCKAKACHGASVQYFKLRILSPVLNMLKENKIKSTKLDEDILVKMVESVYPKLRKVYYVKSTTSNMYKTLSASEWKTECYTVFKNPNLKRSVKRAKENEKVSFEMILT